MLEIDEIFLIIQERFSGIDMTVNKESAGDSFITVDSQMVHDVLQFLKTDERLSFDSLMNMSGVDYPPDNIAVVYNLHSIKLRHKVTLKVNAARKDGKIPTVSDLWGWADWLEREIFDLFGLSFAGHPHLERLLLPPDWVGHPLLKDYKEQEEYNGIPTVRNPVKPIVR